MEAFKTVCSALNIQLVSEEPDKVYVSVGRCGSNKLQLTLLKLSHSWGVPEYFALV